MIALLLSSFLAHAETPVINVTVVAPVATDEADYDVRVPTSQNGVSIVIGSDCKVALTGKNLSAKKVGQLAGEIEAAKSDCLDAKAKRASMAQRDAAAATLTTAQATLVASAAIPVANGGSVSFTAKPDGTMTLDTGPVAETRAAFQAYGQMGVVGGPVDMASYRRVQARIGFAMPQAQTVVPSPAASISEEAELRRALEAKQALIEELSGS